VKTVSSRKERIQDSRIRGSVAASTTVDEGMEKT
jgi:hypothetical protein